MMKKARTFLLFLLMILHLGLIWAHPIQPKLPYGVIPNLDGIKNQENSERFATKSYFLSTY